MQNEKIIKTENLIRSYQARIKELEDRKQEILLGASSATISSGGGSKSYTNHDVSKLDREISQLLYKIRQLKRLLAGASPLRITHIKNYRC